MSSKDDKDSEDYLDELRDIVKKMNGTETSVREIQSSISSLNEDTNVSVAYIKIKLDTVVDSMETMMDTLNAHIRDNEISFKKMEGSIRDKMEPVSDFLKQAPNPGTHGDHHKKYSASLKKWDAIWSGVYKNAWKFLLMLFIFLIASWSAFINEEKAFIELLKKALG